MCIFKMTRKRWSTLGRRGVTVHSWDGRNVRLCVSSAFLLQRPIRQAFWQQNKPAELLFSGCSPLLFLEPFTVIQGSK